MWGRLGEGSIKKESRGGEVLSEAFADVYPNSPADYEELGTLRSLMLPPGSNSSSPPPYSYASSWPQSFLLKLFCSFLSLLPLPRFLFFFFFKSRSCTLSTSHPLPPFNIHSLSFSFSSPAPPSLPCSLLSIPLRSKEAAPQHAYRCLPGLTAQWPSQLYLRFCERKNNLADGRRLWSTGGILKWKAC